MQRDHKLMIRLSDAEKEVLDKCAHEEGLALASWARQRLLRAARPGGMVMQDGAEYELSPASQPELLSLFCGPGGLDEGFRHAGFRSRIATDIDGDCVRTVKFNHPETIAFESDVRHLTPGELDRRAGGMFAPFGVIGGPPCQSFSVSNVHQREDDPRHNLALAYADLLKKLNTRKPISFFLFENVPGLLGERHREKYTRFKREFELAGFRIHEAELDAKDYGVPQERPRVFIVGISSTLHPGAVWLPPKPTGKLRTVRDMIEGLPEPMLNARGLDPEEFPVHPNHWCLVPRSRKFTGANLKEGQMIGRSFRTLAWDAPSWTVAYGHREVHVHPRGHRRLSIFEAMRLQTFPFDYRLVGNMTAQVRLVSEAVPPLMAFHLANSVRAALGMPEVSLKGVETALLASAPQGAPAKNTRRQLSLLAKTG